jgi:hypothetical protein
MAARSASDVSDMRRTHEDYRPEGEGVTEDGEPTPVTPREE